MKLTGDRSVRLRRDFPSTEVRATSGRSYRSFHVNCKEDQTWDTETESLSRQESAAATPASVACVSRYMTFSTHHY
jgi:hypothetical protein